MSDELQLYEPSSNDNKPNWGVIILTGITALLLVVGVGVLGQQVSRWMESVEDKQTATPAQPTSDTVTLSDAALVYAVPHRGEWEITAQVTYPGETIIIFGSHGTGDRVIPPTYEVPDGGSFFTEEVYRIVIEYPNLSANPLVTEREILLRDDPDAFRTALRQTYYALYDRNNRFISVINQAAYEDAYAALPLHYWGTVPPETPEVTPPATP